MIVFLMEFHSWLLLSMIFVGALKWYIPSNIKITNMDSIREAKATLEQTNIEIT